MSETLFGRWLAILALALLIGLTVPVLIRDGMFMDAVLYTSVSHNLANGIGSFWFPQFSFNNVASLSAFHEQPPLAFGIQALFFKTLGSSMWVERIYTLFMLAITAFLIILIRKTLLKGFGNDYLHYSTWLFWIIIPVVFWSYSNNMHENTMTVFTLISVWAFLRAMHTSDSCIAFSIIAALCVVAAALTKGFPGFYTLCAPVLYGVIFQGKITRRAMLVTGISVVCISIAFFFLFTIEPAASSLRTYLFDRALHRMSEVPTVENRFYIIKSLFEECLPAIALMLIFIVSGRRKDSAEDTVDVVKRSAWFCLCLGLAGSAPLVLTKVQKGFYLIPALPFFALSFALFSRKGLIRMRTLVCSSKHGQLAFKSISIFLLLISLALSIYFYAKPGRDRYLLADIEQIIHIVPHGEVVGLAPECWNDWSLQCYLMRKAFISLDTKMVYRYHLQRLSNGSESRIQGYRRYSVNLNEYVLYYTDHPKDSVNWKKSQLDR